MVFMKRSEVLSIITPRPCPICGNLGASPHHIVPQREGGTEIVILCKRCHDLVEEIYEKEGRLFSPELAREIRLRFGLSYTHSSTGRPCPLGCSCGRHRCYRWNRGLTKQTDTHVAAAAVKASVALLGHPNWHHGKAGGFHEEI